MAKSKLELTKITTNINTDVLKLLDKWAIDNGVTRTTALTWLLSKQLIVEGYGKDNSETN